jgi:hypothetical protein
MTLRFLDIRIAQIGVEASRAAIEKKATGPFAGIGQSSQYETLFDNARDLVGGSSLPWHPEGLYDNRFWKKYVAEELARTEPDGWAAVGWKKLVPLRVPAAAALPTIELPNLFRSHAEAFVWPTGFGFCWNNWIRGDLSAEDVVATLGAVQNGEVDYVLPGAARATGPMTGVYHGTLNRLREALWGSGSQGLRSDPLTILSIVHVSDPPSEKVTAAVRETLLKGIAGIWGAPPKILDGDRHAESGQTVYAAPGLRLAWLPSSFAASGRKRSAGCFHRNLIFSSLQVEMLAAAARLLAQVKEEHGAMPHDYQSTVERLRERIKFFASDKGYRAPFLAAQFDSVADARAAIKA